ncbi:hypothetical protein MLD38_018216 [Melastoma candidum]|uniref:Uncharacterized protein n=1 Tax=Melastoma candidum TaxID=119954 RepID=A0ACB9QUF8_9MYRT|nr:hypothetical protein MLD38_018216 [Melastoma candidum]
MSSDTTKKFIARLLKASSRILSKARDLYVRSLTECSGQVGYGSVMGCPTGQYVPSSLPRSFSESSARSSSSSSRDDDYRELMRLASARSLGGRRVDPGFLVDGGKGERWPPGGVPRSRSVQIGRIDEEKPSDFGNDGDEQVVETAARRLRSKSYSTTTKEGRRRFRF